MATTVKPKAVAYARQSQRYHRNGPNQYSIGGQLKDIERYAEQRGFEIVESFFENISGARLDRPKLQDMLQYIKEHDVQYILVDRLDRLTRGGINALEELLQLFKEAEAALITIKQDFNTETAAGALQLRTFAVLGEFQLKVQDENITNAVRKKLQLGLTTTANVPFGYRYNPKTKHAEIDEYEAGIVQEVFKHHLAGQGANTIVQTIKDDFGEDISLFNVNGILARAGKYAGHYVSDKFGEYEGVYPAIISEAVFQDSAQKRAESTFTRTGDFHLLQKRISCQICGRNLSATSPVGKNQSTYYSCSANGTHKSLGEPTVIVPEKLTDEAVLQVVTNALSNSFDEDIKGLLLAADEDIKSAKAEIHRQRDRRQKALVDQQQRKGKTVAWLAEQLHQLVAETAIKEAEIDEQAKQGLQVSFDRFWTDSAYQRQVVHALVHKVTVDDQKRAGKFLTGVFLVGDEERNLVAAPLKIK
jgi:site-specific DNA recombinase